MSRPDIFADLLSQWMSTSTEAELRDISTQMRPVESSNLAAVGYDSKQHYLEVAFLDGSVYRFYNVPFDVYDGLMNAASHGSYFYHFIRDTYDFDRIVG